MLNFQKCEEAAHYQGGPRTGFTFTFARMINSYLLFGGAVNDNEVYLYSLGKHRATQREEVGRNSQRLDSPRSRKAGSTTLLHSSVSQLKRREHWEFTDKWRRR